MTTYFLPAKRTPEGQLKRDIESAGQTLPEGLLTAVTGLLAVLNEDRQIVTLNRSFLEVLGIIDPLQVLGLRPGESFHCIHSDDSPAGCATGTYCRTCGIATAIADCMAQKKPVERNCALQVRRNGRIIDLFFRARCSPLDIRGRLFFILSLEDRTQSQKVAALQRVFFNEIDSLVAGLSPANHASSKSRQLAVTDWTSQAYQLGLAGNVALHKHLEGTETYHPNIAPVTVKQLVRTLQRSLSVHPAATGKRIATPANLPSLTLETDSALVVRILREMGINALEATKRGGRIKLAIKRTVNSITFSVWNECAMPTDIILRVFQRNFSTKTEAGRGLGTYVMKVFGEEILGGRIGFTTSGQGGTCFRLTLPVKKRKQRT